MAWAVVIATVVIGVGAGVLALRVEQDDDVLAFLPATNPEIAAFRRINERFGSTEVALVGIATPDPFAPGFVAELLALVKDLREVEGLDAVLTMTNVQDFAADPSGGVITSELVRAAPADDAEAAALREKVMSRDHVVGTFVSEGADAVVVYGFVATGQPTREVAERMRAAFLEHFPADRLYWGGGPYISSWIFDTTKADMARLTPWSVAVIVLILFVAFRDLLGTVLGLVATGLGIGVTRAAMHVTGSTFNIVLSSMPILLFAVGTAYAIHVLSHVDQHARVVGRGPEAVVRALVVTGPAVIAAGLTTVAGLLSFVTMDIAPMRSFGAFTALGVLVALLASLTFVPALLALFPRPVRASGGGHLLRDAMIALATRVRERRHASTVGVAVVTLVGLAFAGRVQSRMDLRAFFDPGSPPFEAQDFLDEKFGGSQFLQLHVAGDLGNPEVLREVGRLSDRIRVLPHVTGVTGVDGAMELVADALTGARRVPDTSGQVGALYSFLASDPAAARLVDAEHTEALVQVKVGTSNADELDAVLDAVERLVAEEAPSRYRIVSASDEPEAAAARVRALVTARVLALSRTHGVALPTDAPDRIAAFLAAPRVEVAPALVAPGLSAWLQSEESWAPLPPGPAEAVAGAVAALGRDPAPEALTAAIAGALGVAPDATEATDLVLSMEQALADQWRTASARAAGAALVAALGATPPAGAEGERYVAAIASKLQDRTNPDALLRTDSGDAAALTWTVSGMPVLYRGLSRSVTANQFASLGSSLALVLVILTVYYRSFSTALLAASPTLFTLAATYGLMGAAGVRLDIGTSMLASIILGAGVDYGVHVLAAWDGGPHEDPGRALRLAVTETGHAIWTNALTVAAGFFVLTLGDARPLKNVGSLTAAAMVIAALATFAVVPLFASAGRYAAPSRYRSHV